MEDRIRAAREGQAEIAKLRLLEQHHALEKACDLITPVIIRQPGGDQLKALGL